MMIMMTVTIAMMVIWWRIKITNDHDNDRDDCYGGDDRPSLNADEVHAVATANISPGDPVNLVSSAITMNVTILIIIINKIIMVINHLEVFCQLILPAKEIVVSVVLRVFDPVCTILQQKYHKTHFQ